MHMASKHKKVLMCPSNKILQIKTVTWTYSSIKLAKQRKS